MFLHSFEVFSIYSKTIPSLVNSPVINFNTRSEEATRYKFIYMTFCYRMIGFCKMKLPAFTAVFDLSSGLGCTRAEVMPLEAVSLFAGCTCCARTEVARTMALISLKTIHIFLSDG